MSAVESHVLGATEVASTHPVRFWSAPGPTVLVVCADGEGLDSWVRLADEAGLPLALVGIESGGWRYPGERSTEPYDIHADPRARAYIPKVDPQYFAAHLAYVVDLVQPWATNRLGAELPRVAFGLSNGAAWATAAAALHPELYAGVAAFSLGIPPARIRGGPLPPHALVAGTLEAHFHRATTAYARRLRRRGVPVRLRTPVHGHEHAMWVEEFVPALGWLLERI